MRLLLVAILSGHLVPDHLVLAHLILAICHPSFYPAALSAVGDEPLARAGTMLVQANKTELTMAARSFLSAFLVSP